MACNIFEDRVSRNEDGSVKRVTDQSGNESTLYNRIREYINENIPHPTMYDRQYFEGLMHEGYLKGDSIGTLSNSELALGYYSKIHTPTFRSVFGDWANTGKNTEPNFDNIREYLFENKTAEKYQDDSTISYSKENIGEILNPMVGRINAAGMSVSDVKTILNQEGVDIPEDIIQKAMDLNRSESSKRTALIKDIQQENFSNNELYQLYKPYGVTKNLVQKLSELASESDPQKEGANVRGLKKDMNLDQMTQEEQAEAIEKAVKEHRTDVMNALFEEAEKDNRESKGERVTTVREIRSFFSRSQDLRNEAFDKLMLTLLNLIPTLTANNISLNLHRSGATYYNALAEHGEATFDNFNSSAFIKGNEIHIFVSKPFLDGSVAVHEIMHPIMENLLKRNGGELYAKIKKKVEADGGLSKAYKSLNEDASENPEMEEMIDYLSKQITQEIVSQYKDTDDNLDTTKLEKGTLIGNAIQRIFDYFMKGLDLKYKGPLSFKGDVEAALDNSKDKFKFVENIGKAFATGKPQDLSSVAGETRGFGEKYLGIGRTKVVFNSDMRFSKAEDKEQRFRNLLAVYYEQLIDNDGTPNSSVIKAAKELGISKNRTDEIIKELASKDKSLRESTFGKRFNSAFDKTERRTQEITSYLNGRMQDILHDSMMDEIFQTYLNTKHNVDGEKRILTPSEMAEDILEANLPNEVKFYMLSHLLSTHNQRLSSETRMAIVDRMDAMRTEWGRMGRYMRADANTLFLPNAGLDQMKKKLRQAYMGTDNKKQRIEDIQNALQMSEYQKKKLAEAIEEADGEVKKKLEKIFLNKDEANTDTVKEGLKTLDEKGVDTSNIYIGRQARNKGEGIDASTLSREQINEIIDAYLKITKGNVLHAKFLISKAFPGQANFFEMNATRYANAQRYASRFAEEIITDAANAIKRGEPGRIKHPYRFLIKQMLHAGGYFTDFQDNRLTNEEAIDAMLMDIHSGQNIAPSIVQGAIEYIGDLEKEDSGKVLNKERLRQARDRGYELLGTLSGVRQQEDSPYNVNGEVNNLLQAVMTELQNNVDQYYDGYSVKGNATQMLTDRIVNKLNLPPAITEIVQERVNDVIENVRTKENLSEGEKAVFMIDNINKFLKSKSAKGSKIEKLMELAKSGVLDSEKIASELTEEFDVPQITSLVSSKLRNLHNQFKRANTKFHRDRIANQAHKVLKEATIHWPELAFNIATSLFYGGALSGLTTSGRVVTGTFGVSVTIRMARLGTDVFEGLGYYLTGNKDLGDVRFKKIMNHLAYAFQGWDNKEAMKASLYQMADIFKGEVTALQNSEVERGAGQIQVVDIAKQYSSTKLGKRIKGIRKLFSGNSKDMREAANLFVESVMTVGSETLDQRVGKIGRVGISLATLIGPWVLGATAFTMTSPLLATATLFGSAVLLAGPVLGSAVPVLDHMFKSNIVRSTLAQNAFSELEDGLKDGVVEKDEFWNEWEKKLGLDPVSKQKKEEQIQLEVNDILDREEEALGRSLTKEETDKIKRRYRRKRMLELTTEFVQPDEKAVAIRQANMETLTGMPAGVASKFLSEFSAFFRMKSEVMEKARKRGAVSVTGRFGLEFFKWLGRLSTMPFPNVAAHMANIIFRTSPVGFIKSLTSRSGYGKKYNPTTKQMEEYALSATEKQVSDSMDFLSMFSFGVTLYAANQVFGLFKFDDDDDDKTDLRKDTTPSTMEISGTKYRVTGPGTGAYWKDMKYEGYESFAIQYYSEEDGKWKTSVDLTNFPMFAGITVPLGISTDNEIFNLGSDEGVVDNIGVWEYMHAFVSMGFGQSFNQSINDVMEVVQSFLNPSAFNEYEKQRIRDKMFTIPLRPISAMTNPAAMKQTYQIMADISNEDKSSAHNYYNRRDWVPFFKNEFARGNAFFDKGNALGLEMGNTLTDDMGYAIQEDYNGVPEFNALIYNTTGYSGYDKPYSERDSEVIEFINSNTSYKLPSGSGMSSSISNLGNYVVGEFPEEVPLAMRGVARWFKRKEFTDPQFAKVLRAIQDGEITALMVGRNPDIFSSVQNNTNGNEFALSLNKDTEEAKNRRVNLINRATQKRSNKAYRDAKAYVVNNLFDKYTTVPGFDYDGINYSNNSVSQVKNAMAENQIEFGIKDGDWVFTKGHNENKRVITKVPREEMRKVLAKMVNETAPPLHGGELQSLKGVQYD